MKNYFCESIQEYISYRFNYLDKRLKLLEPLSIGELDLNSINSILITHEKNIELNYSYSYKLLKQEIRKHLLESGIDAIERRNYLYYLLKIYNHLFLYKSLIKKRIQRLESFSKAFTKPKDLQENIILVRPNFKRGHGYDNEYTIIVDCEEAIYEIQTMSDSFLSLVCYEFGIKTSELLELCNNPKIIPTIDELNKFFIIEKIPTKNVKQIIEDFEPLPEYEYDGPIQQIAWLHELGILETIVNKCKRDGTYNIRNSANVIHSFTGINLDTIRKCLEAIFKPNDKNKGNHPFTNVKNRLFIEEMKTKFKLRQPE